MVELKEKIIDLYKTVRTFIEEVIDFVVRVVQYSPVLWRDRDYSYDAILTLLKYKLERTRKHIVQHDIIESAEEIGKQIAHAEELIRRIRNDDYCKEEQAAHEVKWGEMIDRSRPSESHPGYYEWDMSRVNAITDKLREQEADEQMAIYNRMALAKQLDMDELFAHIRKHIEGWWD